MAWSRELLLRRLDELKSQRQDAIVLGLASPGVGGGIFNERVQDLNDEITAIERQIQERCEG